MLNISIFDQNVLNIFRYKFEKNKMNFFLGVFPIISGLEENIIKYYKI